MLINKQILRFLQGATDNGRAGRINRRLRLMGEFAYLCRVLLCVMYVYNCRQHFTSL